MQGSVAIEFALVFGVFMALFYAAVSYGVVFMLIQSFTYAAEDGLRAALKVDCTGIDANACTSDRIAPAVQAQVATTLSWLPAAIKTQVLGNNGQNVQVNCGSADATCEAVVQYSNYAANPLVPVIQLPIIGSVPKLPVNLAGRARLRI